MNPKRRKLMFSSIFVVLGTGIATGLAIKAFQENLLYFYSPLQIKNGEAPTARSFRIGGLVELGSVKRNQESLVAEFVLTDTVEMIKIAYDGILPDLFREGQGVVVNGKMDQNGIFQATKVLTKHDENYMPPEVTEAIEEAEKVVPSNHLKENQ